MFQLKTILNDHGTKIKYILWGIFFVAMIGAIRTYVNYLAVVESIGTVSNRTDKITEEINYAKNFESKYLQSDYGYMFLAHENSMIFDGEEIILFKSDSDLQDTGFNADLTHIPYRPTEEEVRKSLSPKESWNLYLQELGAKMK